MQAAPRRTLRAFLLFTMVSFASSQHAHAELGPQSVVRAFCQADGLGDRVNIQTWPRIAPLVDWQFEPAWDRIILISSYTVGWPVQGSNNEWSVEVRYLTTAEVSAKGVAQSAKVESIQFRIRPGDSGGWLIAGPPPVPHLFEHRVDASAMRKSIALGGLNFTPNSHFIWRMLQSAGWNVFYQRTADLLDGKAYREVQQPAPGDLVVYIRDDTAYHVGFLEDDGQLVSSTLNAGVVRTPIEAFAGTVRYLRLVRPEEAEPENTPAVLAPIPDSTEIPSTQATRVVQTPTPAKQTKKVQQPKAKGKAQKKRK